MIANSVEGGFVSHIFGFQKNFKISKTALQAKDITSNPKSTAHFELQYALNQRCQASSWSSVQA
jgi:hypothetical protein